MKILSCVVILLLATIGLAALCRALSLWLFSRRDDCTVMFVTHIKPGVDAEMALRSALSKQKWRAAGSAVVCIDARLDDKTRRICEGVCREYGCARLLTKEEFIKSLD